MIDRLGAVQMIELLGPLLTPREAEIVDRLHRGETQGEIALALDITPAAVSDHLRHIGAKLSRLDR